MRKTNEKKGATFLDVMVSLVVLMSFTGMMVSATHFMARSQQRVRQTTHYNQVMHNRVSTLYTEPDWSQLDEEEVDTPDGTVAITYDYEGIHPTYQTDRLVITFTLNEQTESVPLERSVYQYE